MMAIDTSHIPILLTSSVIAHDKGVRLQNPKERERLAIESILHWRTIAPTNPLVLCDGSGFDFQHVISTLPGGGPVECLHFLNDAELVQQNGRGYGEGEIVRFAIEHSAQIAAAGCFAKCTSKLWVENFRECIQQWNGRLLMKGVFDHTFSPNKATQFAYIDTRFYVMGVEAYCRLFQKAHHTIRTQEGYGLEESFRDIFLSNKLQGCLMHLPPIICGVGGGTGVYYKNTRLRQLKEKWRYQLTQRNPLFRHWFV
jgi:hypothetical protein